MLLGTHKMRMKLRHLKPEYPVVGILDWFFDTALVLLIFCLVFATVFYLLSLIVAGFAPVIH